MSPNIEDFDINRMKQEYEDKDEIESISFK